MPSSEHDIEVDDYSEGEDEDFIGYDITSTPNDFNIFTIYNFIESGVVGIPNFQRYYVWDIKRASKLIESLILGLPVPQIFLYEESQNKYVIIDGQQRLMSIYYFIKKRFPIKEMAPEINAHMRQYHKLSDDIISDDKYFRSFNLYLPSETSKRHNPFHSLNYATLGQHKGTFDLRPLRNVVIRQNKPENDNSAIFEIFSRLNSGGVNLKPQEIRMSLYHSDFYDMLSEINLLQRWRELLNSLKLDLHMKDVELLLRAYAMLINNSTYAPSLVKFLNSFSRDAKKFDKEKNTYLRDLFESFLLATTDLPNSIFVNKNNYRFNIALFEAVFTAVCTTAYKNHDIVKQKLTEKEIESLRTDPAFSDASLYGTTQTVNVKIRINRALEIIGEK